MGVYSSPVPRQHGVGANTQPAVYKTKGRDKDLSSQFMFQSESTWTL